MMAFSPKLAELTDLDLAPPQRTTPALLMSLVFHLILLVLIGMFWNPISQGTGAIEDRPVGIALVHRMPDRTRYVDSAQIAEVDQDSESAAANPTSDSSAASDPPADLPQPLDLAGILKSMESAPLPKSGTGLAGETELGSDAFSNAGPGGPTADPAIATTTVFGISGSGSRFVYVFDRSDSMNGYGGNPLRQAKSELIRSLNTLTERQHFQIVFYNNKPTPFRLTGQSLRMFRAEEAYVSEAESYVRSIAAFGGTSHEDALRLCAAHGTRCDLFSDRRADSTTVHEATARDQESSR